MMKLTRPLEPEELKRNKDALTQEYAKDKKKAVWRKDYIVEPLYKSANKKCAYCGILIKWNKGMTSLLNSIFTFQNHSEHFNYAGYFSRIY